MKDHKTTEEDVRNMARAALQKEHRARGLTPKPSPKRKKGCGLLVLVLVFILTIACSCGEELAPRGGRGIDSAPAQPTMAYP